MNPRLPLPLRRALLAAMCVISSQAYSTTHYVQDAEEFKAAWETLADGDSISLDGNIDLSGVELSDLPEGAFVSINSGGIANFNYKDMSAITMNEVNVAGSGTVRVGNMTKGSLGGDQGENVILSIEKNSVISDTWILLEANKLVVGNNTVLSLTDEISTGQQVTTESSYDEKTEIFTSSASVVTPGKVAIELGDGVHATRMENYLGPVFGKIVSTGDITLINSALFSTGAANVTVSSQGSAALSKEESVGAVGGIDFSAGSVTLENTFLSTAHEKNEKDIITNIGGGDILIGDGSVLTTDGRASIETSALVLKSGLFDKKTPQVDTNMEESLGLYGDIFIGADSSITNYDLTSEGSIFIGANSKLSSVTLDTTSVELTSVKLNTSPDSDELRLHISIQPGDIGDIVIGDNSQMDDVDMYAEGGNIYIGSNTSIVGDNDFTGEQMVDIWAGDTVGALGDKDATTRGIVEFNGILKKTEGDEYVLSSGEYKEDTYGGNVIIGNDTTLTMTSVTAENTIVLGNNVTYQGTEEADVYHMTAFSNSDNSLIHAIITNTDDEGNILNGTVTVTERQNKITTGSNNIFQNSTSYGASAAMDISRGGAIYAHGDIIIGENNIFANNTAKGSGGAIFAQNNISFETTYVEGEEQRTASTKVLNISIGNGSIFSENKTASDGGAIASGLTNNLWGLNSENLFENEGANIRIGKDVEFRDNSAEGLGGAIHLMEGRTLAIGSGCIFVGNTDNKGAQANDIFAEDQSSIWIHTDQNDVTVINGGISDADWFDAEEDSEEIGLFSISAEKSNTELIRGSADIIQTGGGDFLYGGLDDEDSGFGGKFVQNSDAGSLIVGHLVVIGENSSELEKAKLGIEDLTDYEINGKGVILADGSILAGDTLQLNGNAVVEMGEGSSLLVNDLKLGGNSAIKVLNSELDLTHTAIGTITSDKLSITGIDQTALKTFNSAFVSTTATLNSDGTFKLEENMRGVAAPMQKYAGNVSHVAAGMEKVRLNVIDESAANRFFENLLATSSPDAAASMIQEVSGETVVNAAWASNDSLKGFTALGRRQGAASAARGMNNSPAAPSQSTEAKGNPIAMTPMASGRGSVWVGGTGSWVNQNARDGIDGYKYDTGGYAVGADYKLSTSSLVGIAIGQSYGTFHDNKGLSKYDADSCMAMVYGRYAPANAEKLALDGYVAVGTTSFDGKSRMANTDAHGKFDANSFSAAVYATWTEELSNKLVVSPFGGLEFMTGKTDSLTESGILARSISGARAQNWTLPAGVTLSRIYTVGNSTTLTPSVTVAVAQDLSRINPKGTVKSDLGTWTAQGVNIGRTALRINAGINATFGRNWGAQGGYSLESRSGLTSHGINAAVSYSF